jgi:hypothetical protein
MEMLVTLAPKTVTLMMKFQRKCCEPSFLQNLSAIKSGDLMSDARTRAAGAAPLSWVPERFNLQLTYGPAGSFGGDCLHNHSPDSALVSIQIHMGLSDHEIIALRWLIGWLKTCQSLSLGRASPLPPPVMHRNKETPRSELAVWGERPALLGFVESLGGDLGSGAQAGLHEGSCVALDGFGFGVGRHRQVILLCCSAPGLHQQL